MGEWILPDVFRWIVNAPESRYLSYIVYITPCYRSPYGWQCHCYKYFIFKSTLYLFVLSMKI